MMRIIPPVPPSNRNSIDVDLEHANEVIYPRHYGGDEGEFRFSVNGRTLTITRIDTHEGWWEDGLCLRV